MIDNLVTKSYCSNIVYTTPNMQGSQSKKSSTGVQAWIKVLI